MDLSHAALGRGETYTPGLSREYVAETYSIALDDDAHVERTVDMVCEMPGSRG